MMMVNHIDTIVIVVVQLIIEVICKRANNLNRHINETVFVLFSIWIWKWFSRKKSVANFYDVIYSVEKLWIALNQLEMIATLKIFKKQTFYSKIIWKMSKIKTCGKSTYHLQWLKMMNRIQLNRMMTADERIFLVWPAPAQYHHGA